MHIKNLGEGKGEKEIIYVGYKRKDASERSVSVGGDLLACCQ